MSDSSGVSSLDSEANASLSTDNNNNNNTDTISTIDASVDVSGLHDNTDETSNDEQSERAIVDKLWQHESYRLQSRTIWPGRGRHILAQVR